MIMHRRQDEYIAGAVIIVRTAVAIAIAEYVKYALKNVVVKYTRCALSPNTMTEKIITAPNHNSHISISTRRERREK